VRRRLVLALVRWTPEVNMAEFDQIEKHFLDRAFQSNFALWSALLTVNGIILSGFGLLRVVTPTVNPVLVLLLVGSSGASILLLVLNFLVTREHYLEIGRRLQGKADSLSDEQRKQDLRVAGRKHRNTRRRETAALLLLLVEVGLVLVLLWLPGARCALPGSRRRR
jgi:hypothetical protein